MAKQVLRWRGNISQSTGIGTMFMNIGFEKGKTQVAALPKPRWLKGLRVGQKVVVQGNDKRRIGRIESLYPMFHVRLEAGAQDTAKEA